VRRIAIRSSGAGLVPIACDFRPVPASIVPSQSAHRIPGWFVQQPRCIRTLWPPCAPPAAHSCFRPFKRASPIHASDARSGRPAIVCERGARALASSRRSGSKRLVGQGARCSSRAGARRARLETLARKGAAALRKMRTAPALPRSSLQRRSAPPRPALRRRGLSGRLSSVTGDACVGVSEDHREAPSRRGRTIHEATRRWTC
jgi:hypothetical protein